MNKAKTVESPKAKKVDIIDIPERFIPSNQITVDRPVVKTTALDWLSINFLQPLVGERSDNLGCELVPAYFKDRKDEIVKGDWQILPSSQYSRIFKNSFDVYYQGIRFAIIYSNAFSAAIKTADAITMKVLNDWLYCDWLTPVKDFMKVFKCRFDGISRIDIALDGVGFIEPMQLQQRKLIRIKNHIKIQPYQMGNNDLKGFYLGSRNSDRYLRCYWKNEEIEVSKKEYIRSYWRKNGIEDADFSKMQRCEIVMKAKELKKYQTRGVTFEFLESLVNPETLQSLAKSSMDTLYHFTEMAESKKKNVSRLKRVCEIVFEGSAKLLKRTLIKSSARLRSIQTAIKVNYQLYLKSEIDSFKYVAHELISDCDLGEWFKKKKPKFIYEFELEQKKGRPFYPLYSGEKGKRTDLFAQPVMMRPFVGI